MCSYIEGKNVEPYITKMHEYAILHPTVLQYCEKSLTGTV